MNLRRRVVNVFPTAVSSIWYALSEEEAWELSEHLAGLGEGPRIYDRKGRLLARWRDARAFEFLEHRPPKDAQRRHVRRRRRRR